MIYLKLFWSFFQIGLISFGGGYAAMGPIYDQVVTLHGWISPQQFTDLITISQMTPGPIALNSATFVGLQIAGFPGAVFATLGNVFPSVMIVSALAYVYFRFSTLKLLQSVLTRLKPVVLAMIGIAAITLSKNAFLSPDLNYLNVIIFVISLIMLRKTKINPTLIIFLSGFIGVLSIVV